MKVIKGFIASHQSEGTKTKPVTPSVSAVDDELFRTSLSAALMKSAEATQPWSTIGVDQWIESGRWWLLRAQMELYAVNVLQQKIPLAAYTNLIKASWILIDIIACHPQVPFIKASTHSEIQLLSAELKNEFSRLSVLQSIFPDLSDLEEQDLQIWETQARGPLLRPHKDSRRPDEWTVDGGEQVLFQRFALCKLHVLTESLPCILLFLVSGDGQSARVVIQNQNGAIIMAVSFLAPVQTLESDSSVSIKDEKITFNTIQDAQHFGCLVEATNFYYFGRRAKHASLENLKAYVLITAVKNQRTDVIQRLLQRTIPNENAFESQVDGGPMVVASMLASQRIANQMKETSELGLQGSTISLFPWAVQCGLAPLVKVLLIEHPTIDEKGWHGMTPLGLASSCGYEPVVRVIIGSGTDVQATDSSGWAALDRACSKGHEEVARLLLRSGAEVGRTTNPYKSSALHLAARNGHVNVVQLLIDSGADIEAQDYKGYTPLCRVCKAPSLYHEAIIALLLEKGANVNQRNECSTNAMHYAFESQMSESTVRAILAKQLGRRDNIRDNAGLRKGKVTIELNFLGWAKFYVDSPNAVIEMPTDIPSNVKCAYNRMIYISRPSGSHTLSRFGFEFMIVHNENTLDFSVDQQGSIAPKSGRWASIKVGNLWRTSALHANYPVESGLLMFTGVELGESAPRSSAEEITQYPAGKEGFWMQRTADTPGMF